MNDPSVDQNPSIEYRIQETISSEDPDLVIDLCHLNTGRPGDTFQVVFFLSPKSEGRGSVLLMRDGTI